MKILKDTYIFLAAIGIAALFWYNLSVGITYAATVGDPSPAGKYGTVSVPGYDGGTGSPTLIPFFSKQNAFAIFNNGILDGGTSQTIYCGFDTSVTPSNGFPVPVGASLSIDLVSLVSSTPLPYDGGVGNMNPKFYCVAAQSALFSAMDVRRIVVR